MESLLTHRVSVALGLQQKVVGVRFIAYKAEFDALDRPNDKRRSFCWFVKQASLGEAYKASKHDLVCSGGTQSLGMEKASEPVRSGRGGRANGMYEDLAVARQVNESMCNLEQEIYGVEVAPLEDMQDADVVLFICLPRQAMRLIQGYAYHFGMPEHLYTVGNKAVCSDLVSKPITYNDLNISFMCCGARAHTKWDDSIMGVAMPIGRYRMVVDGVLKTINPAEFQPYRTQLLERLSQPDELGIVIEPGTQYPRMGKQYYRYCEEMERLSRDSD